jgi:hypothetical protein
LSATTAVAAVAVLGAALAMTAKTSEMLPLFGLAPWARWGAWLGLAAGVLGLLTVVVAIRQQRLPRSRMLGLVLTGLAAFSLALFLYRGDWGPFSGPASSNGSRTGTAESAKCLALRVTTVSP